MASRDEQENPQAKDDGSSSTPEGTQQSRPKNWICPRCDTEFEPGYSYCWKCLYNPSSC